MRRAADMLLRGGIITAFAVLLACVSWQVISRYVLGTPSTVTDELARFIFMWLALVGGAFTYGQGRHLAIDFLPMSVEGRKRQATEAAITLLIAAFAVIVMIWGGSQLVLKTLASGQISPALRLPMGWVYGAVPVAGAIVTAYAAGNLLRIAQGEQILKPADEISVEMADPEESKR